MGISGTRLYSYIVFVDPKNGDKEFILGVYSSLSRAQEAKNIYKNKTGLHEYAFEIKTYIINPK